MKAQLSHVIEAGAKLPKYQQFVNSILGKINNGDLKPGEKLPSIVDSSIEFDLSRDTIGRAYKELCSIGVITSIYRKGYFVSATYTKTCRKRVLFVTGKCSTTNQMFYSQFSQAMAQHKVEVDCMLSHNNMAQLENIINKEAGNYHIFIIEPQLLPKSEILEAFNRKMVSSKVVFINDDNESLPDTVDHISFSIEDEFVTILDSLSGDLDRYHHLNLVLPEQEYFPSGLISGFFRYCDLRGISGQVLEEPTCVEEGHGYFVIDETSLFKLADNIQKQQLIPGQNIGLMVLFENDYLKYMFGGISSINWFNGNLARYLVNEVLQNSPLEKPCSAEILLRNSL